MIEFDEYKVKLNNIRPKLDALSDSLGIEAAKEEIERLHAQIDSDGFWDNQEVSQKVMKQSRQLESKVELYERMCSQWDDLYTLCEMAIEEGDDSMLPELTEGYAQLEQEMEKARLETLLSGEYDNNNAIVSFQAGAGGWFWAAVFQFDNIGGCHMRGIPSLITDIRKKVFTEVARMAYSGNGYEGAEDLPFKIVPGDQPLHRESIFLERAIAGERVRLAMGLSIRPVQTRSLMTEGMDAAAIAEQYYEPPLINIIPYACHACPTNQYRVTENCQNCLAASCQRVCPKGAVSFVNGKSHIDPEKCIKCGKCASACPYHAIIHMERPCQAACGMDAIVSDEHGRAKIDQDKCVACGQCLVSCPFGAIVDKGQIFQVIQSILKGDRVIAIVAPAFIGQFSGKVSPGKFVTAMKQLGFDRVMEVAIGADLCTIEEAKDFLEKVPEKQDYMATSCCPAWHSMIEKLFPGEMHKISMTLTPMVFTARMVKKDFPGCKVVFVGPCAAKKLEAIRADIRSDVDFVLTFEELQGMFEAKQIDFDTVEEQDYLNEGTSAGRGFAVSGGVAKAVTDLVHEQYPDMEIQTARAEGLRECRKLMMLAKAGKFKGCLLEGMACPGGCVAGAGTILPVDKAAKLVEKYSREAAAASPVESAYSDRGESLE